LISETNHSPGQSNKMSEEFRNITLNNLKSENILSIEDDDRLSINEDIT